jgi:hypothetical protein
VAQGQEQEPATPAGALVSSGSVTVGFKAIQNEGDLNYFRERYGERAGLTLQSLSLGRDWPGFRYFRVESLFTPEHNSRTVLTFGSIENFRLRLKYDRIQNYYSTSSTNFSPASPQLFTLPGELTMRRTVGEVDFTWNIRRKALLHGGYTLRRSNGSDLQLLGGSYFTVLDFSLPTQQTLSTFHHTYRLGLDVPVGPFRVHLLGEVENLNTRDSFPQPQIAGIALDRELVYRNEGHTHSSRLAASVDFSPRENLFFNVGYQFQDLRNNPQWSRQDFDQTLGTLSRRGDQLRAQSQFHGLFGQAVYTPRRAVALRYRVVQEWGEGFGRGFQFRFEDPLQQLLTESLESQSTFDSVVHREQVSLSLAPGRRVTLRMRYGYDRRARDYTNFFTPFGVNFADGASVRYGVQTANVHNVQFDARVKATDRLQLSGGLGRREFDVRQKDTQIVRHYFLGDRNTDTNFYHAGVKYRATRRSDLEFDFRREARDYSATTSGPSPSRNTLTFDVYSVSLNLHPTSRWFLFGLLHYIRTDAHVLGLTDRSLFTTFAPFEYLVSNTGFLVGTSFTAWNGLVLGVQFQQNNAAGNERYRLHDTAASVEYELAERWSVGGRYQLYESSVPLTPSNNHRTHVAQALLNYRF